MDLPNEILAYITTFAPDPPTLLNLLLASSVFHPPHLLLETIKEGFLKPYNEDGICTQVFPSGVFHGKYEKKKHDTRYGTFHYGKKVGLWTKYYHGGNLCYKRKYVNGLKEGVWKYWSGYGKLAERLTYHKDQLEGSYISYNYITGSITEKGEYHQGKKNGLWLRYHLQDACILRKETRWIMGQREGETKAYYSNGVLKKSGYRIKGKRKGWWTFWARDGTVEGRKMYL